ncbi:MAG: GNAT family N-acetyltransferase [Pseudomonadota bacterium]
MIELETERLRLRGWVDADHTPFAALNADPEVMAHFPAPLSRAESDALIARQHERWAEDGMCFQAVERKSDGRFLGLAGLAQVRFPAAFTPAVETGWRLARHAWGQGYASEAARAWLDHGFKALGLTEIVAFTALSNTRSAAVMSRIGMTRAADDDFDHPALPEGHALRAHLLCRIRRDEWFAQAAGSHSGAMNPTG